MKHCIKGLKIGQGHVSSPGPMLIHMNAIIHPYLNVFHYETVALFPVAFSRFDRLNIVTSAIKPNTHNKMNAK